MATAKHHLPEDSPAILERWHAYRSGGDLCAFDALCVHYLPAVQYQARRIMPREKRLLQPCDLISAGSIGLIKAIKTFQPDGKGTFVSFSWSFIRRAMLDELELYSWRRKGSARRDKFLAEAREAIERREGRRVHDDELLTEVVKLTGWSGKRFGSGFKAVQSIETMFDRDEDDRPLIEQTAAPAADNPEVRAQRNEVRSRLFRGLAGIDRQIVRRFLLGGEQLNAVASAIGVHRATLSHRLRQILLKLSLRTDLLDLSGLSDARVGDPQLSSHFNRAA